MATSESIWTRIKTVLDAATATGQTLAYMTGGIFAGIRNDLVKFPVVVMEPVNESERRLTTPSRLTATLTINLLIYTEVFGADYQIVGEGTAGKGIMDIAADVKNVLQADPKLNGLCLFFDFPDTEYGFQPDEYSNARYAKITMAITYESVDTAR